MRALLVEGAAAARVDDDVREELSELLSTKLDEWRAIYHEVQITEKMDPEVDMDTLVVMLVAVELGLGVMESIGHRPPQARGVGANRRTLAELAPTTPTTLSRAHGDVPASG